MGMIPALPKIRGNFVSYANVIFIHCLLQRNGSKKLNKGVANDLKYRKEPFFSL